MNEMVTMRNWPPHPQGCGCSSCCGGGSDIYQCWEEISRLKQIIKEIMAECGGPVMCGPIQGVIDGSQAKPGQVGEFLQFEQTFTYAGYPTDNNFTVSIAVIPPGDWDMFLTVEPGDFVGAVTTYINPLPVGLSNNMRGWLGWTEAAGAICGHRGAAVSRMAQGNFSVPTLIPVFIGINQGGLSTLPAGSGTVALEARRMR